MSYPHRVRVSRPSVVATAEARATVTGEQVSRRRVVLDLPIVPVARLRELLEGELVRRGFRPEAEADAAPAGGTRLVRERDGLREVFDPAASEVTTTATMTEEVRELVRAHAESQREAEAAADRAARRRSAQLQDRLHAPREAAARRLAETDAARERELNEVAAHVYVEALKEKAATLGEVEAVREQATPGTGEVVVEIRVRVE